MAFVTNINTSVKGVTVCMPNNVVENNDYDIIPINERTKFIESIGIERRRVAPKDVCTSDLCLQAAEHLIKKMSWDKSDIDLLVFVSQTPDYKMPATSCILQERLGLSMSCMTIDISQGCSGFVYGLSIVGSLISNGSMKKALLLTGNTQTKNISYYDKSAYPLFSDAGSALAIEYSPINYDKMNFYFATDGSGENTIIIPDGGYRNPISQDSFKIEEFDGGIRRNRLNLRMEGADVFSFVISQVPKAYDALFEHFNVDRSTVDYYLIHHASKFLCEKLRKKMGFEKEKTPFVLKDFGNASNASIPLLLSTTLKEEVESKKINLIISGFGVGLSLGIGDISLDNLKCADLIDYV
jgi:3-oxoacyl-[acyl-carrier-protein] synthase-3